MNNQWTLLLKTGLFLVLLCVLSSPPSKAQELQLEALQKNIDIFSGVLAEALELEQPSGLFGISLGGIESIYLFGQGVVMEVTTPLSTRRNTMGLVSLNSTLQALQFRSNPFEEMVRPQFDTNAAPATITIPLTASADGASEFYLAMMEKIASVDYSLMVNGAIQQASEYARSLRSLGNIDDIDYQKLREDIDGLRDEMQVRFTELRQIESEVAAASSQDIIVDGNSRRGEIQITLDSLLAQIEPLRDRAIAKAGELRGRTEVAEEEYAAKWQQEVLDFESSLYTAMCNYGSTLRELPEAENVSIILTGLGKNSDAERRADKIHVFSKANLLRCQNGEIDVQTLRLRSAQYDY